MKTTFTSTRCSHCNRLFYVPEDNNPLKLIADMQDTDNIEACPYCDNIIIEKKDISFWNNIDESRWFSTTLENTKKWF